MGGEKNSNKGSDEIMKWDNAKYAEPSTSFFCLLAVCFCCNGDGKESTDPGWISRIAVRIVY